MEVGSDKYEAELAYWNQRKQIETELQNAHYEELMLRLAQVNKSYFANKTVGDFGCGPRGSLEWMDEAKERFGIDVLVDQYLTLGIDQHKMNYVKCNERAIPLSDEALDILFSVNAIDHASDPDKMLDECFRIVKRDGLIAMSINLDEPASPTEPNTLTEKWVSERVASRIAVRYCVVSPRHPSGNKYRHLYDWSQHGTKIPPYNGSYGFCWITGFKK